MKRSTLIYTSVGALAIAAMTMPAEARGFGPGFAGGLIAGALVAGAASSVYAYDPGPAYAYGPGPAYAYGSYARGPGYYAPYGRNPYGTYDESQHGGQPSSSRPF